MFTQVVDEREYVQQKRATYLLETLLADGLRVDLHLEDDGVGLADEAPHLRDRSSLGRPSNPSPSARRLLVLTRTTACTFRAFSSTTTLYDNDDDGDDVGDNDNNNNDGLSFPAGGYAAGRRPVVAGGTLFVITKLQKLRTRTAVTATTGPRATTTCDDVGNVLASVPETERASSASISRRGMAHALTASSPPRVSSRNRIAFRPLDRVALATRLDTTSALPHGRTHTRDGRARSATDGASGGT